MPFFSVIVPLYNKEPYVLRAINSILNQTFTDFELLIVNDKSTDNSLQIVEKINSDKIRIIQHESNKGLAATRNTGIRNATSEYITFLDADDEWYPFFLETIYDLILKFPDAGIFGTNYHEDRNGKIYQPVNGSENLKIDYKGLVNFFKINLKQGIYCHGSVCFKKEIFNKIGFYNSEINFAEDLDFNTRANHNFKLAYSNQPCMLYYMETSNQLTRSTLKNKLIPDYDKYEPWTFNNPDLKKYLDFERYVLGKRLKISGDQRWKKIIKPIKNENLNWKQKLLLQLPIFILKSIDFVKSFLFKIGIKISTYN